MSRAAVARTLAAVGLLLGASAALADPFVFVSLPDTQVYAENRFPDGRFPAVTDTRGTGAIFFDQVEWIVDNRESRGIRYVGHLGDIVQDGNDLGEWALATDAMRMLLDADIPHGTVMGNHDDNHPPDYARNYLDHFGPQFFEDRPWFTASSPGGGANLQMLEHGPYKLGFLNFSIDHPQSEIDWATGIVQANPDTIFVIGTHRYLFDLKIVGGRYGERINFFGSTTVEDNFVDGVVEPNNAQDFFDEFVTQHPNILMVHAGHFHAEWLRLDGLNSAAKTVIQILTDYQSTRNGGDGYLRIYELDFDAEEFRFETYSPSLDRKRTTLDHYVETIFLAYDQRDQIIDVLGASEEDYFDLLEFFFKSTGAPDGFLLQHPDFDEPEERAYYERYLDELFLGDPPEGFGDILEWEGLWLLGFANDPQDPFDFRDSVRSPTGVLGIDYADYFVPSADQRVAFAFEELIGALTALEPADLLFRSAGRALARRAESALRHAENGRHRYAKRLLERGVLRFTDGCAEGGSPDGFWPIGRSSWWRWLSLDWVDRCSAQETVHPLVLEAVARLEEADAS